MVSITFLCVQCLALPFGASCLSGGVLPFGNGASKTSVTSASEATGVVSLPVAADGVAQGLVALSAEGSLPVLAADSATVEVDASGFTTTVAPSSFSKSAGIRTIPLQKQYVPIKKGEKTIAYKTAYFGTVYMGFPEPQEFTAVFDTGSGHFIVPSDSCASEACLKHRRYSRAKSTTAVEIEYDGKLIDPTTTERDSVAIAFGTGQILGEFVEERVCLGVSEAGGDHCTKLRVVVATEMTSDPFGLFAFDGVMGLGLDALTLNPAFSFFGQLAGQMPDAQPQFAVFLARDDVGENSISFGGYDTAKATSEIEWAPVAMPELGYWQVQIKSVRIGEHVLEACADGSCRAILDTGTSLLSVPREAARTMHRLLAREVPEEQTGDGSGIDCRRIPGQIMEFDLGHTIVRLGAEDYSRPTPFNMTVPSTNEAKLFCRSLLLPMDMKPPLGPKVFIWGEPVLRRYYTIYDIAKKQIGFSVASEAGAEDDAEQVTRGLPAVGAPPPGSRAAGAPLTTTADNAEQAVVTSV